MRIENEFRVDRNDVIAFYDVVRKMNDEQTEIIDVEEKIKETTLIQLESEYSSFPEQIKFHEDQVKELKKIQLQTQQMIDLAKELEENQKIIENKSTKND